MDNAVERLKELGVVVEGHFVLASGKHSDVYVNKHRLYNYSDDAFVIARDIVSQEEAVSLAALCDVEALVGPERGGAKLALLAANELSCNVPGSVIRAVAAEKSRERYSFVFEHGAEEFVRGKNVMIIDDVATTGGSLVGVKKLVEEYGGTVVVGILLLWDRGNVASELGLPVYALISRRLPEWSAEECKKSGPCSQGVPVNTELGHGA